MFLRQSTSQVIRFGPFVDSTDGVTAETALTIAQADMQLSKDGGAFAQKNATGNATHDTDGWYSTTLNATDTNTVGILKLQVVVAGALHVWETFYVVEEQVYDRLYAASAVGPLSAAEVNAQVDQALVDIHLDHLLAVDYDPAIKPGVATALLNELIENDGGVSRLTANALEQVWAAATRTLTAGTNLNDISAADVWAVATRTLTAGTNLNDISQAQVLTQVNAALDTAIAELGVAAPTATPTLRTGLMLLYMALRNKVDVTASAKEIHNDAGTVIATKTLSDDGTTYSESEMA